MRTFAVWLALAVSALGQHAPFRHYGRAQGLANLTPQALLQDRTGFLWVGTQNGLFRYDGARFDAFGVEQGLPSPGVMALHEGADGTLWVGTANGLARREGERFVRVALPAASGAVLLQGIASAPDGTLLVGLAGGLAVGRPGHFTLVPGGPARGLYRDTQGDVFYWCGARVCRWRQGKVEPVSPELDVTASRGGSVMSDGDGRLWARVSRGLFRREGDRFVPVPGVGPSDDFATLALDSQGRLLVATDQGLAVREQERFTLLGRAQGLAANSVTAMLTDREGNTWLGLAGAGLTRWLGAGEWENWSGAQGPGNDNIWGITRDAGGALWVATDLGVHWRDERGWHDWPGLPRDRVQVVRAAADGAVWVGAGTKLLARLDRRTGATRRFTLADGLEHDEVKQMSFGHEGRLWVATRRGLFVSTPHADAGARFTRLVIPGEAAEAAYEFVLAGRDGRSMWLGGGRGLFHFDGARWTRRGTGDGLLDDRVARLAETPDGALWFGYRNAWGLTRVDAQGRLERFTTRNGLHADQPISLFTDARGRLWHATDAGVEVLDGGTWRHYGEDDGLVWDDANGNAFHADADGSVWIGTSAGLSHFRPRRPLRPGPVAPVLLSAKVEEHALTARFTALSFQNEASVRFRVKLAGADGEARITSEREVRYTGLDAGDYRLEVEARAGDGPWTAMRPLAFTVHPPWWRSWPAMMLWALLLCAAGWGAAQWRTQRLLARQQELETAVAERTAEVERLLREAQQATRYKSEFLANMSHEIRTPMNGILGLTELALQDTTDPGQKRNLELVQSSSRALLAIVNDILDLSKVEAGKLHLESIAFSLRQNLEAVAELARPAARAKGLGFEIEVDPALTDTRQGDPHRLRQVLLNLVGNAVKFTERGGVAIRVSAGAREGDLQFAVRDTGIGIAPERLDNIFESFQQADSSITRRFGGTGLGLTIARQLATLMGGGLRAESQVGEGSTFLFTAHLPATQELTPASVATPSETSRPLRVLLAEDNAVGQYVISAVLKRRGHGVILATDGAAAVEAALREPFDVVLMDVQMPVLDGLEATRRIRAAGNGVRIVALTASALKGDREQCLAAGMDGFVSKPIEARDLLAAVERDS